MGSLFCVLCFLTSFVGISILIGRMLPFPDVQGMRQKLDRLATHGDDFDAVVIGSSRVEQQFIPSIFDQTSASLGCPVRSFNAGMAAMVPPEDSYVLDEILKRPHRRLRWVFIELMPLSGQFDPSLAGTVRMDYWHDWRRMQLLTKRAVFEIARAWQERRGQPLAWLEQSAPFFNAWCNHVASFAKRSANYGRGAVLISWHLRGGPKPSHYDDAGPTGDGWIPEEPQFMHGKLLVAYEEQFAELREYADRHVEDPLSEEALRHKIELLRRNGIETVLFLPPTLAHTQFYPTHTLETTPLFDLSDIAQNPDLYAAGNHKDGVHLNVAGSGIFTRKLATLFAERFKIQSR